VVGVVVAHYISIPSLYGQTALYDSLKFIQPERLYQPGIQDREGCFTAGRRPFFTIFIGHAVD